MGDSSGDDDDLCNEYDNYASVLDMLNLKIVPKEPNDPGYIPNTFLPSEARIYAAEYCRLDSKINEQTRRIVELEDLEKNLKQLTERQQQQLAEKTDEVVNAKKTASEREEQVESLTTRNSEFSDQIIAKDKAFEKIKSELEEVKGRLIEKENAVLEAINQMKSTQKEISDLKEELKSKESIISSKSKECADAQITLEEKSKENESKIAGLNGELEGVRNQNLMLQSKVEELERGKDDIEKRYANSQNEVELKTREIEGMKGDLKRSGELMESLTANLRESETQVIRIQKNVQDLENCKLEKQKEIDSLKMKVEEVQKKNLDVHLENQRKLNSTFELISTVTEELKRSVDGMPSETDEKNPGGLDDILPQQLKNDFLAWQDNQKLIEGEELSAPHIIINSLLQLLTFNLKNQKESSNSPPPMVIEQSVEVSVPPILPQQVTPSTTPISEPVCTPTFASLFYKDAPQQSPSVAPSVNASLPTLIAAAFPLGRLPSCSSSSQSSSRYITLPDHFPLFEDSHPGHHPETSTEAQSVAQKNDQDDFIYSLPSLNKKLTLKLRKTGEDMQWSASCPNEDTSSMPASFFAERNQSQERPLPQDNHGERSVPPPTRVENVSPRTCTKGSASSTQVKEKCSQNKKKMQMHSHKSNRAKKTKKTSIVRSSNGHGNCKLCSNPGSYQKESPAPKATGTCQREQSRNQVRPPSLNTDVLGNATSQGTFEHEETQGFRFSVPNESVPQRSRSIEEPGASALNEALGSTRSKGSYPCQFCGRAHTRESARRQHLKHCRGPSDKSIERFLASHPEINNSTPSTNELPFGEVSIADVKLEIPCDEAESSTPSVLATKLHGKDYSRDKKSGNFCKCGHESPSQNALNEHVIYKNADWFFECPVPNCLRKFKSTSDKRKHMWDKHQIVYNDRGCRFCGEVFPTMKELNSHQMVTHRSRKKKLEVDLVTPAATPRQEGVESSYPSIPHKYSSSAINVPKTPDILVAAQKQLALLGTTMEPKSETSNSKGQIPTVQKFKSPQPQMSFTSTSEPSVGGPSIEPTIHAITEGSTQLPSHVTLSTPSLSIELRTTDSSSSTADVSTFTQPLNPIQNSNTASKCFPFFQEERPTDSDENTSENNAGPSLCCKYCQKEFPGKGLLRNHLYRVHNILTVSKRLDS